MHYSSIIITKRENSPLHNTINNFTSTPTCCNTHPPHLSPIKLLSLIKTRLVAQRCAQLKHVVQNKAGTAESSAAYCRVFYHLAECRTPPHSLATSFKRSRLEGSFARRNSTLTANKHFTRSTMKNQGRLVSVHNPS